MTEYSWERSPNGMREHWELVRYYGGRYVVGTVRMQSRRHCRRWIVAAISGWDFTHVCVLYDMKRREAMEAAKLILLSLKDST